MKLSFALVSAYSVSHTVLIYRLFSSFSLSGQNQLLQRSVTPNSAGKFRSASYSGFARLRLFFCSETVSPRSKGKATKLRTLAAHMHLDATRNSAKMLFVHCASEKYVKYLKMQLK